MSRYNNALKTSISISKYGRLNKEDQITGEDMFIITISFNYFGLTSLSLTLNLFCRSVNVWMSCLPSGTILYLLTVSSEDSWMWKSANIIRASDTCRFVNTILVASSCRRFYGNLACGS